MSGKKKKTPFPLAPVKLFVYGTLKRGGPLNSWLRNSEFVTEAKLFGHTLISLGPYPALVNITEVGGFAYDIGVVGEVWKVPVEDYLRLKEMEEAVGYEVASEYVCVYDEDGDVKDELEAKCFVLFTLQAGTAEWEHNSRSVIYAN